MTFYQDPYSAISAENKQKAEADAHWNPAVNVSIGAVKGLAGAVEGIVELATLFNYDAPTNLGLGATEGFAQGLGSFTAEIAAAYLTGGAALAGGARAASKVGKLRKFSSAASKFKSVQPEVAARLASGIAGRTSAAGTFLKTEARVALGEFITVTGERGFDAVSALGLDDTDLGQHFAQGDGKSELENRLLAGLNGFAIGGALHTVGAGIRGAKKGLQRTPVVEDEIKEVAQDLAEEFDNLRLSSVVTRDEVVAVARAARVDFDSTGPFSNLTRTDFEETAAKRIRLRDEVAKIDDKIREAGGVADESVVAERRALLDEEAELSIGFGPDLEALAAGNRELFREESLRGIKAHAEDLKVKRKGQGKQEYQAQQERFGQVDRMVSSLEAGKDVDFEEGVDYLQTLSPVDSTRLAQTVALGGRTQPFPKGSAPVDLPGDLGDIADEFAEKQVKVTIGEGATKLDIQQAQRTYRQHMANLLSDVKPLGRRSKLSTSDTARSGLLALERIEMVSALRKSMKGELFLDDAVASRRIFGRKLAGAKDADVAELWAKTPKRDKLKVRNLARYAEEIQKGYPDMAPGEVLAKILKQDDTTLWSRYREYKIARIMSSPTLQTANVASTVLRGVEERSSEFIGGRLLRARRSGQVGEIVAGVPDAIRNGKALEGMQLASIQAHNFATRMNMAQWSRAGRASFKAQGRKHIGSTVQPSGKTPGGGSLDDARINKDEVSLSSSALRLDPRVEAKVNIGARMASAADDAAKASVIAQTTTNNIFNTLLQAAPDQLEMLSRQATGFQELFHDGITAAIRGGTEINEGALHGILRDAAELSGTTAQARQVLTERIEGVTAEKANAFLEASYADMAQRAPSAAQHRTFTNLKSPEKLAQDQFAPVAKGVEKVQQFAKNLPDGWRAAILPFVNTPLNVFMYGLDFTPMSKSFWDGLYTLSRGNGSTPTEFPELKLLTDLLDSGDINATRKIGRAVTGVSLGAGLLTAHTTGALKMSGSGPQDPQKRKQWMQAGNQPYAIEVAGQSVSFDRMGTMALPFRMAADIADIMDNPYGVEGTSEHVAQIMGIAADTMVSGFLMESAVDLVDAFMEQDADKVFRILGNEAAFAAPAGVAGALGQTGAAALVGVGALQTFTESGARIADPSSPPTRDLSPAEIVKASFFDRYKAFGGDTARNVLGQPVKARSGAQEALGAAVGIAKFTTPGNDALDVELASLRYPIGPPQTTLQGLNLLDEAYASGGRSAFDRYSELVGVVKIGGKTFEQALMDTIRTPRYRKLSREGVTEAGLSSPRHEALAAVVARYRAKAQKQVARERPVLGDHLRQRKIAKTALTYGQSPESITARFFPEL